MILMVAVDEANGLTFGGRRQSKDALLREKMLALCGEHPLWVNTYTARQFSAEQANRLCIAEDFMEQAGEGDYCFLENIAAAPYLQRIERLILFQWNRRYPADFHLDIALTAPEWKLEKTAEFAGHSHEKITMEEYRHEII